MKKKKIVLILIFVILYGAAYGWYRQTHNEIWEKNGKTYVIFPKDGVFLYYLFRPIAWVDWHITGMGFHIGPHQ